MLVSLKVVVLFVMVLQVQLVVEVVHALVVFLVPIHGSECAGGGTIGSGAAARASGSGDSCTGSISSACIC